MRLVRRFETQTSVYALFQYQDKEGVGGFVLKKESMKRGTGRKTTLHKPGMMFEGTSIKENSVDGLILLREKEVVTSTTPIQRDLPLRTRRKRRIRK